MAGLAGLASMASPGLANEKKIEENHENKATSELEAKLVQGDSNPSENSKSDLADGSDRAASESPGSILEEDYFQPSGYIQTAIVSDYVGPHGMRIKGSVRQDFVNINLLSSIIKEGDSFSVGMWANHDLDTGQFNERDYLSKYSFPINDNWSARIGFQRWDYPSETFGDHDNVIRGGVNYHGEIGPLGKMSLDFDLTHLLAHGGHEEGDRLYMKAKKSFTLYQNEDHDFKITATPEVSSAVLDNYYADSGFAHLTAGGSLTFSKNNFNITTFLNKQEGQSPKEDFWWGGVKAGYKF
jgi:hypothetical protein